MFQKIKNKIAATSALLFLLIPIAAPAGVFAASIEDSVCSGAGSLKISPGVNDPKTCADLDKNNEGTNKANQLIGKIINIFSIIVGIVAVIMIIFGGFKYITSAGNQESVKTAKNIIIYALIGLIIVALSQVVVKFVLREATQVGECVPVTRNPNQGTNSVTGEPCVL